MKATNPHRPVHRAPRLKALLTAAFTAMAATAAAPAPVGFTVTSLLHKSDDGLTRITGQLVSTPHTSCRIDSVTCLLGSGQAIGATDIDGVDFRRYFQWEGEGVITLEIDIPAIVDSVGSRLIFHTVRGDLDFSF